MVPKLIFAGCLLIALLSAVFAQASGPRVELSMIVTDKKNNSLSSLRKEDVRVFEDNIEQTILNIETDERPIDIGIAIELINATLQLGSDLAKQFRVIYQSSNNDPNKTFRKVEVKVTPPDGEKRTGIVRRGYNLEVKPAENKSP